VPYASKARIVSLLEDIVGDLRKISELDVEEREISNFLFPGAQVVNIRKFLAFVLE